MKRARAVGKCSIPNVANTFFSRKNCDILSPSKISSSEFTSPFAATGKGSNLDDHSPAAAWDTARPVLGEINMRSSVEPVTAHVFKSNPNPKVSKNSNSHLKYASNHMSGNCNRSNRFSELL